ncbi:cupin domain-containing protein [Cereibacter sp. SYSU M97828]|nr:cupin domain-containing protein [Cereibacter flavus]
MAKLYVAANASGKSVFLHEGEIASNLFRHLPGFDPVVVWGKSADGTVYQPGDTALAPPGGSRLLIVTFPPPHAQEGHADPADIGIEMAERLPGLAETFEADGSGMHRTPTYDYGIVLDGEIQLELDDGEVRVLRKGDVSIHDRTRHGWRNTSPTPCTIAFVMIGRPDD